MKEKTDSHYEDPPVVWEGPVPLTRINRDIEMQVRKAGLDMDKVKEYANALQDPMDHLPAVHCFTTAAQYNAKAESLLADGFHRSEAYSVAGRQTIPIVLHMGDRLDALKFAIKKNGEHGIPFTQKDRVYIVKRLLAAEDTKGMSVRAIAELVGCSKSTIQNIKNPPEPSRETKTRTTTPETKPDKPEAKAEPHIDDGLCWETDIIEDRKSVPNSDGPAVQPAVVRERQPSDLPTINERLNQIRAWADDGLIDRGDVMNLFSNPDGRLVWVPRMPNPTRKMLLIRHGNEVLIEAEVRMNAELPGVLDVEVASRRAVEYSAPVEEEEPELAEAV